MQYLHRVIFNAITIRQLTVWMIQMPRLLLLLTALFFAASAIADTTIDINTSNGLCSYTTGAVTTGSEAGHLLATQNAQTTAQGPGCGGSGGTGSTPPVEFGPASPLAPSATTLPGTSGSVPYTFQPLHATSCTGSFTGGNGSSTASFSGGASLCAGGACNSLLSKTANFTNTSQTNDAQYTVYVTCNGDGSPATSTATVTVPHQSGGGQTGSCPTIANSEGGTYTRLTGNQNVYYYGGGGYSGTYSVDVTDYAAVWHAPWPGGAGYSGVFTLPTNKYISMQFTVPTPYLSASNVPAGLSGQYVIITGSNRQALLSMTLSTSCGDFSNPSSSGSTVVSGCYLNKGHGAALIGWGSGGGYCALQDGQTYYLNMINADVANVTHAGGTATPVDYRACTGTTCTNPIQTQGSFNGYVPQQ